MLDKILSLTSMTPCLFEGDKKFSNTLFLVQAQEKVNHKDPADNQHDPAYLFGAA